MSCRGVSVSSLPVFRYQFKDGFADHFFRDVTEYTLRKAVPAGDHAVEGFTDNGIVTASDDGGQFCGLFFCHFMLRNIQERADKPVSRTFMSLAIISTTLFFLKS